jgi:nitrate/TMAO reductase-like tetraheme cytochrome c subunit
MTQEPRPRGLIYNWLSLFGVVMATIGFVAGAILLWMDYLNPSASAYSGIFTYLVVPVVLSLGLLLILVGVLRERKRRREAGDEAIARMPVIDLNDRGHYVAFVAVSVTTFLFIVLSAFGSYRAYQYTDSVEFCGTTCHSVMKPEHTAYLNSPHANVRCVDCHIGPGATSFVKSKLSGLRQVYAVLANDFHRPIQTPIPDLRPAPETCYECHWPAKFFGVLDRTWTYYAADASNTPYSVGLLMKVGGADPTRGPPHGIHWHVSANKVEYIAKDPKRQVIPWIRVTHTNGEVTVYTTKDKSEALTEAEIAAATPRVMDCIDCHTRPSHQYRSPNRTLDIALSQGQIDASIPKIKRNAAKALLGEYDTEPEALDGIEEQLRAAYPEGGPKVDAAILAVQQIYSRNFFPEMKVRWDQYPDNIGHMIVPGCFRCHDDNHANDQGRVISKECNNCHLITAQGPGAEPASYDRQGLEFVHPGSDEDDEFWKEERCDNCHSGAPDV